MNPARAAGSPCPAAAERWARGPGLARPLIILLSKITPPIIARECQPMTGAGTVLLALPLITAQCYANILRNAAAIEKYQGTLLW